MFNRASLFRGATITNRLIGGLAKWKNTKYNYL